MAVCLVVRVAGRFVAFRAPDRDFRRVEAALESLDQVDDLGRALGRRLDLDVLTLALPPDEVEHPLAIGVLVARRLPLDGQAVDQLVRDAELTIRHLRAGGDVEVGGIADLVGEVQRLQHEHLVGRADRGEVLLGAHDEARDRDASALRHRVP